MIGALAQILPERVPAASAGELLVIAFGGSNSQGGRYVVGELIAGGSGASAGVDGVDVIETDATNCMNLPAEAMEMEAPIRIHRVALRKDSGGAGTFRGGLGVVREYEIHLGQASLSHRGERHFFSAPGLDGGSEGAKAHSFIRRAGGDEEVIPSKMVTTLSHGRPSRHRDRGGRQICRSGMGGPASRCAGCAQRQGKRGAARSVYGQARQQ